MNEPQLYLENVDAFIRTLFVNGSMRSLNNDDVNTIKNMTKNMENFIKDYPEYEEYNNIKTRLNNNPSLLNPSVINYISNVLKNGTLSDFDKNRLLSYVDRTGGKKRNRRTNRRRNSRRSKKGKKSRGGRKSKKRRTRGGMFNRTAIQNQREENGPRPYSAPYNPDAGSDDESDNVRPNIRQSQQVRTQSNEVQISSSEIVLGFILLLVAIYFIG